jgi:hypothetical protein
VCSHPQAKRSHSVLNMKKVQLLMKLQKDDSLKQLTINIHAFQHGNIICIGRNMKVPSREVISRQQWKDAWLGVLYS